MFNKELKKNISYLLIMISWWNQNRRHNIKKFLIKFHPYFFLFELLIFGSYLKKCGTTCYHLIDHINLYFWKYCYGWDSTERFIMHVRVHFIGLPFVRMYFSFILLTLKIMKLVFN